MLLVSQRFLIPLHKIFTKTKTFLEYYNLQPNATVRDVVLAVRADEAVHRDANHFFADRIAIHRENILEEVKQKHEEETRRGTVHNTSTA